MNGYSQNTLIEDLPVPPTDADLLEALKEIENGSDGQEPLLQDLRKVVFNLIYYGGVGQGVPFGRKINTAGSLTGGGDLSADLTLSLDGDSDGPGISRYYGTDAGGTKGWFSLPNLALYVPTSRIIASAGAIQGGGNLGNNLTFSLEGEQVPVPNTYYGTNPTGTARGYFPLPDLSVYVQQSRQVTGSLSVTGGGDLSADRSLSLVGDMAVVPSYHYYGTNGTDGALGWRALPQIPDLTSRQLTGVNSVAGGGDLSADRTFQLVNDVPNPGTNQYYGTGPLGTLGYWALPSAGNFVPTNRKIITPNSIQGGGALSSDLTLSLVGDQAVVNNLNYYGTDGNGNRGYFSLLALFATTITGEYSVTGGGPISASSRLSLVNDQQSPPNSSYYGTNSAGTRGWFALPTGGGGGVPPSTRIDTTNSLTGGGDLSTNRTLSLVGDVATPTVSQYYGTNPSGIRGWFNLPSGGGGVPATTKILTINSITGGGDLSADRTHQLVGDMATPSGNSYYGTDSGGNKGWFALPPGQVPAARLISTQFSITGGGDLSADRTHSLVGDIATPGNSQYYGTGAGGVRGWYALPAAGAPTTTQVNTAGSLTGGGDLSQNRTHSLVNDNASPGNSMYYGTNISGAKGFYALPSTSGFVPTTRLVNTANSLAGGGALSGDLTLQLQADVAAPGNTMYYGTDGSGNRGWYALSGLFVPSTRRVSTQFSVTGGGDLSADRTLNLVGDTSAPGNNKFYGTDASGARGWFSNPAFGSAEDVGTIKAWPAAAAPPSYMLANGAAISRTAYPELFALVGTTFGPGDGSSTFNLPDMRGRFLLPAGQGSGLTNRVLAATGGEEAHQLTIAELAQHNHTGADSGHAHTFGVQNYPAGTGVNNQPGVNVGLANTNTLINYAQITIGQTGGNGAHNTMPPFLVVVFIIKVSPTGGATAQAPLADATQNGLLRRVSGNATDYVGGDNNCHPVPAQVNGFVGKTGATTLTSADSNKLIICSNGSWNLTLPTPALGFCFSLRNDQNCFGTTGTITVVPSSGTIDGQASLPLLPQQECQVICDGTNWRTYGLKREVILGTQDISASTPNASILLPVGFRHFELTWTANQPAAVDNTFIARLSTDGGATWLTASNYYNGLIYPTSTTATGYSDTIGTGMLLGCQTSTALTAGHVRAIIYPGGATRPTWVSDSAGWRTSDSVIATYRSQGFYNVNVLANALQYYFSASNILNSNLTVKGVA